MKELFDRILKSFGLSGRDWAALLLALLLAFSIWLIHNLSLRYNDYLTVSITAKCNLDGHSDVSMNKCEVVARCRTTGYSLIRSDLFNKERTVAFEPSVMKHLQNDVFYVTSSDLLEYGHLIYGNDVTVEYFTSDTLFFRFPVALSRKVPVLPVCSISFPSQYMSIGEMRVEPDSVTIYGEPYRLDNVDQVYTRPIKRSDVTSDIQGVIGLEKLPNVRISHSEVRYSLDVTRFVEIRTKVPVKAVNVPKTKEMIILPSMVEVSLKCVFPLIEDPKPSLEFYVDYDEFITSLSGKCQVKSEVLPRGVIGYEVEPLYVECIAEDR